jgi:cytochrome c-type biogenesis protein CcmH
MKRYQTSLLMLGLVLVGIWATMACAADANDLQFATADEERRYQDLIAELRCLVCQNQSLADSDADLAKDLRNQVYELQQAGRSDRDIIDYLVARYGDFVRYRPPFNTATLVLWLGPFLLLAVGALALARTVRKRTPERTVVSESSGTFREETEE